MVKLHSVEKNVGEALRAYRKAHKLTQGDLAEKLKISVAYVSKIEKGAEPTARLKETILDFLEESVNLTEDKDRQAEPKESPLEADLRRLVDQICDDVLARVTTPQEQMELIEDFLAFRRKVIEKKKGGGS